MKHKIKRFAAAFLVGIMITGAFSACSPKDTTDNASNGTNDANNKQTTQEETREPKEKVENQTINVTLGDVQRGGVYSGEVVDGKPNGIGRFDSKNSLGEGWYYEGMWKDGQFNGEGKCIWENGQIKEGIYENGIWTPTPYGFYEYIFSLGLYGIETNAEKLIKEHPEFFPASEDTEVKKLVDSSITVEKVQESPENYGDKMLAISNAYVAQVEQMTLEDTGDPYTYMIVVDNNDKIYEFYFIGTLKEEIKAADTIKNIYGVPLGKSLYPNVSGGISKSILVAGSFIEK